MLLTEIFVLGIINIGVIGNNIWFRFWTITDWFMLQSLSYLDQPTFIYKIRQLFKISIIDKKILIYWE